MHIPVSDSFQVANSNDTQVYLIGARASRETHDMRTFLDRNHVVFEWIDLETNILAKYLMNRSMPESDKWPICLFPDGSSLSAPSRIELARRLGLHTRPSQPEYDLAIIGAGPAGLTAAVYAASEGLRTVVIEREATGGQASTTSRIENYPGFPDGISGMALTDRARQQAERFGAEFILVNEVTGFDPVKCAPFEFYLLDGIPLRCHTTIVATGATYRILETPGIARFNGQGVYYGTAMSEAMACEDKNVYVVGGGNSAGQTVLHLAQYAESVTLLVRSNTLTRTMSQYLIEQLEETDNVTISYQSEVVEAQGDFDLERLVIAKGIDKTTVAADALFILIGQRPATGWVEDVLSTDRRGFLLTGDMVGETRYANEVLTRLGRPLLPLETSGPGVFAAGDVRHGSVNRVAWAVGEGAMAVQLVHQYLDKYLESDLKVRKEVLHSAAQAPRIDLQVPRSD